MNADRIYPRLPLMPLLLFGILAFVACEKSKSHVPETAPLKEGRTAPDFSLRSLSGKQVTLSDYRGKVVLLAYWAVG